MAGRLYRMAKVVSANPKSWGIVDANEISGFKRVAKLSDLYSIAECILSSSYGDGVTDGADAVGQIWHVSETNGDYKLINWANRKSAAGWTKLSYGGDVSVPVKDVKVDGTTVLSNGVANINLNSRLQNYATTAVTNDLRAKIDKKADNTTVTAIMDTVSGLNTKFNTFKDSKGQANGLATLDEHGYVPLNQLGNLDMTVFTVVESLPTSNIENKVYLVRSSLTSDKNNYIEYIYTGDRKGTYDATKWEKLGEVAAKTDLSGYYKKTEVYNKTEIDTKVTKLNNSINNNTIDTFTAEPHTAARPDDEHKDQYRLNISLHNGVNKTAYIKPASSLGSGVMTYAQKVKLDGIAVGANNYTHPTHTAAKKTTEALYKITVDDLGHVNTTTAVVNADVDKLITVDSTLDIHSNHPVSGNAVNKYINNKKLTTDNLTDNNDGVISDGEYVIPYALINGNGDNKLRYDGNAFVMHCEGDTVNLRINGASLWNSSDLTALTDTELNEILV